VYATMSEASIANTSTEEFELVCPPPDTIWELLVLIWRVIGRMIPENTPTYLLYATVAFMVLWLASQLTIKKSHKKKRHSR